MIHVCTSILLWTASAGGADAGALFDASADPQRLQTIRVEGLANPACGTVYPAGALPQGGMPLGGLGTGYLCLDADGRLGKCSIFNRLPAPLALNQPFLFLTLDGRRLTMATPKEGVGDVKGLDYFGHFPVADVRFQLDVPVQVSLRAYSPFLPGDAAECNTPAAVFEVRLTNVSDKPQQAALDFSPGGFPEGSTEPFTADAWSGIEVTHRPIERSGRGVRPGRRPKTPAAPSTPDVCPQGAGALGFIARVTSGTESF